MCGESGYDGLNRPGTEGNGGNSDIYFCQRGIWRSNDRGELFYFQAGVRRPR